MTRRIEIYRDERALWRWRFKAANGHVLADGAEGYAAYVDCLRGLAQVVGLPYRYLAHDGRSEAVDHTLSYGQVYRLFRRRRLVHAQVWHDDDVLEIVVMGL